MSNLQENFDVNLAIEELIEESVKKNASTIESSIDIILNHMVKYYCQRTIQTNSWIKSIRNNSKIIQQNLSFIKNNKNSKAIAIVNYFENEGEAMDTAVTKTVNTANKYGRKFTHKIPHIGDKFFTLDDVADPSRMEDFLKEYAYSNEACLILHIRNNRQLSKESTIGINPDTAYKIWREDGAI